MTIHVPNVTVDCTTLVLLGFSQRRTGGPLESTSAMRSSRGRAVIRREARDIDVSMATRTTIKNVPRNDYRSQGKYLRINCPKMFRNDQIICTVFIIAFNPYIPANLHSKYFDPLFLTLLRRKEERGGGWQWRGS